MKNAITIEPKYCHAYTDKQAIKYAEELFERKISGIEFTKLEFEARYVSSKT